MNKPNISAVVQLMRGAIDRMQREGKVHSREGRIVKLQDVFPFRPEDVQSISYAGGKTGSGNGVRFTLVNGRIFDDSGQVCS